MDAPTIGRPMGARCATYTLHRVSAQHLLSHRHPESRVCFPPRAREPFYATFSYVSRCHAGGVWVTRAYVCTLDVRMCLPSCARSLVRSFIRTTAMCARTSTSLGAFVLFANPLLHSCGRALRLRLAPVPSVRRVALFLSLFWKTERKRGWERTTRTCPPRGKARPSPVSPFPPPSSLLPVLVRHGHTPDASDVRTPLCAYRAGLQRNAKESLTSTHPWQSIIDSAPRATPLFLRSFFVYAGMYIEEPLARSLWNSFRDSTHTCLLTFLEFINSPS